MNHIKISLCLFLLTFSYILGLSQSLSTEKIDLRNETEQKNRFSIYMPWLNFSNFGNPKTNTQHYELLLGYNITAKDRLGIKIVTWKLFAPMGIPMWDDRFLKESSFYPGRLTETGIGLIYQRRLWKGLFATVEVLPLFKTYLNQENEEIAKGFKLYSTYHLGYHFPLFKKGKFFLEPQIHLNQWTIDTNTPTEFKAKEVNTNTYFFFEPNLYLGYKF